MPGPISGNDANIALMQRAMNYLSPQMMPQNNAEMVGFYGGNAWDYLRSLTPKSTWADRNNERNPDRSAPENPVDAKDAIKGRGFSAVFHSPTMEIFLKNLLVPDALTDIEKKALEVWKKQQEEALRAADYQNYGYGNRESNRFNEMGQFDK